jgi:type III secretion protein T
MSIALADQWVRDMGALIIACARFVGLLIFVPVLPAMLGGTLVRVGLIVALALPVVVGLRESGGLPASHNQILLTAIATKEVAIGALLGLVARVPMFVVETVGAIIDNLRGGFAAEQADRSRSPEESVLSDALSRLMVVAFVQSGAFVAVVGMTYASYRAWPILQFLPTTSIVGTEGLFQMLGGVMEVAVRFALPFLLVCLFVDVCLGFVAIAAPRAETYFLAMPIKSVLSMLLLNWVVEAQFGEVLDPTVLWMHSVFPWGAWR